MRQPPENLGNSGARRIAERYATWQGLGLLTPSAIGAGVTLRPAIRLTALPDFGMPYAWFLRTFSVLVCCSALGSSAYHTGAFRPAPIG